MKGKLRNSHITFQILMMLVLPASFVSCRPHGILHSWEMKEVLVDLHKADAMIQLSGLQHGHEEARSLYYAQVLEKHGVTQAQFDSSLVWYTAHPQLFDKIYPKVLTELKAEEELFMAIHEAELSAERPEKKKASEEPVFTRQDLDSVLWVTRNGCPSTWNPLMHDTVYQFFPQISVLR